MLLERRAYERGCKGGGCYNGHCDRAELISTSLKSCTLSYPLPIPSSHTLPSYSPFLSIHSSIHLRSFRLPFCSALFCSCHRSMLFYHSDRSLPHFLSLSLSLFISLSLFLSFSLYLSLFLSLSLSLSPSTQIIS